MKNKKILALFAIPLVICVMVLPLCSFTTVKGDNYGLTYRPSFSCDVGYTYHRVTNTLDEYYYGFIYDYNNTLVFDDNLNSIKNTASGYYILSGKSLNYCSTTSLDYFPSSYYFDNSHVVSSVASYFSSNNPAYFNGSFIFNGYERVSDIDANSRLGSISIALANGDADNFYQYSICDFDLTVSVQTVKYSLTDNGVLEPSYQLYYLTIPGNVWQFDDVVNIEGNQGINNRRGFSVGAICDYVLTEHNADTSSFVYKVTLNISNIFDGSDGFEMCAISDNLYLDSIFMLDSIYPLLDSISDNSYDVGYLDGVEFGENSTPWDDFVEFLEVTVGGFLDFEIAPHISISSILGVLLSVTLVIAFLKIFAGG